MARFNSGRIWLGFYGLVIGTIVTFSIIREPRFYVLGCDGPGLTTTNISVQESRWLLGDATYGFIPRQGSPIPRAARAVTDTREELRLAFEASPAELVREGGDPTRSTMDFRLNRKTREFQLARLSTSTGVRGWCDRYVGGLRSSWAW
jgi:hypothetical protein